MLLSCFLEGGANECKSDLPLLLLLLLLLRFLRVYILIVCDAVLLGLFLKRSHFSFRLSINIKKI